MFANFERSLRTPFVWNVTVTETDSCEETVLYEPEIRGFSTLYLCVSIIQGCLLMIYKCRDTVFF